MYLRKEIQKLKNMKYFLNELFSQKILTIKKLNFISSKVLIE